MERDERDLHASSFGADVVAVEPDSAMLTELRRALPDVRALSGSAEEIPRPDGLR